MKVLVMAQTFPLDSQDGTAHFMKDFCEGLVAAGEEVVVLLPYHPKLRPESFRHFKTVSFKYIWPDRFHLLGFGNTLVNSQFKLFVYFLAPFYYLFGILALFMATRQFRIEIVSVHWVLPNGFIAGVINMLTGVPYVVNIPGSDAYVSRKNFIFKLMAKFAFKRAREVVSNSAVLLSDLKIKGKLCVYGVEKNNKKRVIHKGIVIAGAGRRTANKNLELIKKIEPEAEILTGLTIEEFRKKLLGIDIFICPSVRDRAGNLDDGSVVVLEAMGAGSSVIASDLPGYRMMIEDGKSGFLVDIKNEKKLINILKKLKKDKDLRGKIGREARKRVGKYFTREKVGKFYANLFATIK